MINARKTFANYLYDLVTVDVQNALPQDYPELNFVCEDWETITYPVVILKFLSSNFYSSPFKEMAVGIDVIFNNRETEKCEKTTAALLKILKLDTNYHNEARMIDIYNYDTNPASLLSGKIFWQSLENVVIHVDAEPEIRKRSFTLKLIII